MLYFLCLVAIGLAVWNRTSIDELARFISELQKELAILRRTSAMPEIAFAAAPAGSASPASEPAFFDAAVADKPATPPSPKPIMQEDVRAPEEAAFTREETTDPPPRPRRPSPEAEDTGTVVDLERQFGARLPVWIGGIALALAGFFLVRYTIEIGLLTETVRVALGGIFGVILIAAGHWAARKESLANGQRIGQALAGAGIADLYASLFVATTLYHLLSPAAGFVGMAAVTIGAVALSLRQGAPIAVLGLVGGFLTPLLTGSTEPNAPLLFGYLYCLLAGFFAVIRKKGWWLLAIPTVFAAFGWVLLWLESGFDPPDAIWPLLFIIAVSATVAFASHRLDADASDQAVDLTNPISLLRYISLGGGILLAGGLAGVGGFEPSDWALFGLLSGGVIALTALQPRIYNFAPLAALVMSFAMFVVWGPKDPDPLTFGLTIVAFGLLHCISGYVLMWRSPIKAIWGTLVAATALGYYLLAYAELDTALAGQLPGFPIWGALAAGLALGVASIAAELLEKLKKEDPARTLLVDGFSAVAAAFVTIGLAIELDRQWVHVAIAGQVLVAVWLAGKVPVRALKPIAGALLVLFGLLIMPLSLVLQAALADVDNASRMYRGVAVDWAAFRFGAPALMLFGASLLLRHQKDDAFAKVLESVTAFLIGATIYLLTRQAFHLEGDALLVQVGELESSVTTSVFFLSGLGALWLGHRFQRSVAVYSALAFALVGVVRLLPELSFLLALSIFTPSDLHSPLIEWPIIEFGIPALSLLVASMMLRGQRHQAAVPVLESITAVLLGAMIYCLARQAFHPGENALLAPVSFIERGVVTNIFFLSGLAAFWLGRQFERATWTRAGFAFSAIALFRIVFFDLIALNPVWSHQFVGNWPLINGLALSFGLPIMWSVIVARHIRTLGRHEVAAGLNGLGFVLLFVLVTLNVRQFYWGGDLDGDRTLDAEVYAYSAAWLLLGVGLLVAGTIRKEQMIRVASLVVILIAVGKVFLIDASSLEGLYRIVSFFGLGVTLIALSWFYTRYVFVHKDGRPAMTPPRTARSAQ